MIDSEINSILVVDDEEEIVSYILEVLERTFDIRFIVSSPDGLDAWAKLRVQSFDFAILDINMPKKSGLELLEKIRTDKNTKCLPVIIISGRFDEKDVKEAALLKVQDFLTKPFSPDELIERVSKVIERIKATKK